MKEALLKVSIYNNIIARFVDEITSKYGMALTFSTLEPHEIGHWAETFQVASGNNKVPKSLRPQQACKEPHKSGQPQPIQQCSQTVTEWPQQLASQPLPTLTGQHLHHHKFRNNRRKLTG